MFQRGAELSAAPRRLAIASEHTITEKYQRRESGLSDIEAGFRGMLNRVGVARKGGLQRSREPAPNLCARLTLAVTPTSCESRARKKRGGRERAKKKPRVCGARKFCR